MKRTDWKAEYNSERTIHSETKALLEEANGNVLKMQSGMWAAQRAAQADRNRFEECERQRIAAQSLADTAARLQAERDLLLMLVRELTSNR